MKKKTIIQVILVLIIVCSLIYYFIPNNNPKQFDQYYKGSYKEAYEKLLPAAEKGDASAQVSLGNLYARGLGVRKDLQKAFYWYKKAANQNNSDALGNIGLMYKNGIFLDQNEKMAIEYYNKALKASDSNLTTKYNLALIYLNSNSGHKNLQKGLKLLKEAASQNNSVAQYQLGTSYYLGLYDLPVNYNKAFELVKQSAEQGDPEGQNNLAVFYYQGKAIKKDDYKAYKWFYIASKYGNSEKAKQHY